MECVSALAETGISVQPKEFLLQIPKAQIKHYFQNPLSVERLPTKMIRLPAYSLLTFEKKKKKTHINPPES